MGSYIPQDLKWFILQGLIKYHSSNIDNDPDRYIALTT